MANEEEENMAIRMPKLRINRVENIVVEEVVQVASGPTQDRSGTVTESGAWQLLMAANPSRRYILIENKGADDLRYKFGAGEADPDAPGTFTVPANNGSAEFAGAFVPGDAIYVTSNTAGIKFSAREG